MTLNGSGFSPNSTMQAVTVQQPDQQVVTISPPVVTDATGAFSITYTPPAESGRYKFTATDGVNTATTASTEADSVGFSLLQCAQNASANGKPLGLGSCSWLGGDLNSGNSQLYEGNATEQQLIMSTMPTGAHTLVVGIEFSKGGNHSYDWLVSDAQKQTTTRGSSDALPSSSSNSEKASALTNIQLQLNRCADLGTSDAATCNALVSNAKISSTPLATPCNTSVGTGDNSVDVCVPGDPFISATFASNGTCTDGSTQCRINAYEAQFGPRTCRLYTDGALTGIPTMSLLHSGTKGSGPTIISNGGDTGDSYIWYTLNWNSAGTNAMFVCGADIALGDSSTRGQNWGNGLGAANITGSPYHFYLISLDGSAGSLDNQMASSAVFALTHLTLVKSVVDSYGGTAPASSWTLSATGPTPISGVSGSTTVTGAIVGAGSYTLSESGTVPGYTNGTTWNCTDTTGGGVTTTLTGVTSITLAQGDTASCTIANHDNPASLQLIKSVVNSYGGTAIAASWTTTATGPTTISGAGGVGPSNVSAGTYTLSETGSVTGYTNGTTYNCVYTAAGGTAVTQTAVTSIALSIGDTGVCTITNHDNPASLRLIKSVVNSYGGTAVAGSWTTSAAGPTPISGAGGVGPSSVSAGTYTLSESGTVHGYTNGTTYSCVLNGGTAVNENSIALHVGDTGVCTISNHDNPTSLQLIKAVVNSYGGTAVASSWTTIASGPTPLSGSGGVALTNVNPGIYTLSESGTVNGYTNGTTYSCVTTLFGGTAGAPVSNNSLTLGVGDSAVCTISNHDNPGSLRLIKNVVNSYGGTAVAGSWTTSAAGPTPISGAGGVGPSSVSAGTYTLSESGTVHGYTNGTTYSCVLNGGTAVSENSITLATGDTAVCTISNHDNPTSLQLIKAVVNSYGGTALASSWTTSASGPTPLSGSGGVQATTVNPGTYTLSESGTINGYTNGTTYSCVTTLFGGTAGAPVSSNSVMLGVGDSAVCTITNHDNPASLRLIKNVVNSYGGTAVGTSWTTSAAGPTPISGSGGVGPSPVNAGIYTLSESGTVHGYTNGTTYSCVLNGGTAVSESSITLAVGDIAVCTISNHDNPTSLQLIKAVVNSYGGTALASSWITSAAGPTPLSGSGGVQATTVNPGTYTLSETGTINGYTNGTTYSCVTTLFGGTAGAPVSSNSVMLGVGDSAVCTITNHDNPASLRLIKNVVNSYGGTAVNTSWTTSAAGPTPISGAGGVGPLGVRAGMYTLSESGTVHGYTNGATYSCVLNGATAVSENSITLAVGDTAVCTISNHDNPTSLQLIKAVVNSYGGTALAGSWTTSASGPTPLSGSGGVPATYVHPGSYTLSESGMVSGYTNGTTYSCVTTLFGGTAGLPVSSNSLSLGVGDSAVCTITNHDNPSYIIVNKITDGATGTFSFSTGTVPGTTGFTLSPITTVAGTLGTTAPSGGGTSGAILVLPGNYSVGEPNPTLGWVLTASGCVLNNGSTPYGASYQPVGGVDVTWSFTVPLGSTVTCTFDNGEVLATTRTQGFWATHTGLADTVWNGGTLPSGTSGQVVGWTPVVGSPDASLCGFPITAVAGTEENILMGGFWSGISKTSNNQGRTSIDQVRMQMVQQYLAAVLNYHLFGSIGEGILATARTAYCGTDASAIQQQIGILGSLNSQGDSGMFTPGISATTQTSKSYSDIDAWDIPQFPGLSDEDAGQIPYLATVKNVTGAAVAADFTLTATCTAGACAGSKATSGAGGFSSTTLKQGVYTLSESTKVSAETGYTVTVPWACTGAGNYYVGPTTSGSATLAVGLGANVSCSITNNK